MRSSSVAAPGVRVFAFVLLVLAVSACGDDTGGPTSASPPTPHATTQRLVWLAVDGAELTILEELVRRGRLPHFERLMKEGAYGPLRSMEGYLSPSLWTTQATGLPPDEHGISGFTFEDDDGVERLVTSNFRRRRALWDILGERGLKVSVVGWLATWPASPVEGFLVSSYCPYSLGRDDATERVERPLKGTFRTDVPDLVHPPELIDTLARFQVDPERVEPEELARLVDERGVEPLTLPEKLCRSIRFTYAADRSFARIARHLYETEQPALHSVYLGGVDVLSHRLWRFTFQSDFPPGAEDRRRFGGTIQSYYEVVDEELGHYLSGMDEHTTLVVSSDHGFRAGSDYYQSGTHREYGVVMLYGPRIQAGVEIEGATLFDMLPTLLALMDLPSASDLPGRVLDEVFQPGTFADHEPVGSYAWEPYASGSAEPLASTVDDDVLERLRSLGYVGDSEVDHSRFTEPDD